MSENLPSLPENAVEVVDVILRERERLNDLGWRNRDALYSAGQMHAYARTACAQRDARIAELEAALRTISGFPLKEQDNMVSANMRVIALAALKKEAQ